MLTQPTSPFDLRMRMIVLATAFSFMALEYGLARLAHHDSHDLREKRGLVRRRDRPVADPRPRGARHGRAVRIRLPAPAVRLRPDGLAALLGLFVSSEFLYYWHHRASHRVRWLWATHSVHHSPTRLNLTAAIRLGWTGSISGSFVFFLPLAWIGFHPLMIVGMLSVNLLYQFFIHTELSPRLGPLEWVLNTPDHHRVHHASNDACLDKNYGGILIVFDRFSARLPPRRRASHCATASLAACGRSTRSASRSANGPPCSATSAPRQPGAAGCPCCSHRPARR